MKINAFGKEIELKKLTIGDIAKISKMDKESFDSVVYIVSRATGIPEKELLEMDADYVDDFTKIVEQVIPGQETGDSLPDSEGK